MQATITYLLSEQAQRAQMAATGQPVARKQTHTIDILPEDIEMLKVDELGNLSATITSSPFLHNTISVVVNAATPAEAWEAYKAAYYAEKQECEKKQKAEREAEEQRLPEMLAGDAKAAEWIDALPDYTSCYFKSEVIRNAFAAAGVKHPIGDKAPLANAAMTRLSRRHDAWVERTKQAKEAEEQAKEAAKTNYIDEWVRGRGDDVMRAQHADGLLPRKEALEAIAAEAFAELPDAYVPAICNDSSCPCGRTDIDTLPRQAYQAWQPLKAKLPEGASVEFERVRECLRDEDGEYDGPNSEAAADPVYAALLKVPVGPFTFERLVHLR